MTVLRARGGPAGVAQPHTVSLAKRNRLIVPHEVEGSPDAVAAPCRTGGVSVTTAEKVNIVVGGGLLDAIPFGSVFGKRLLDIRSINHPTPGHLETGYSRAAQHHFTTSRSALAVPLQGV